MHEGHSCWSEKCNPDSEHLRGVKTGYALVSGLRTSCALRRVLGRQLQLAQLGRVLRGSHGGSDQCAVLRVIVADASRGGAFTCVVLF